MKNLGVLLTLVLLLTSCAGLKTKQTQQTVSELENPAKAPSQAAVRPEVPTAELLSSKDVSRGRKLPSRYQRFEGALKALDENALMEEAAKFLAADQHDIVVLNGLGIFHMQRGRPEAARIFWERAKAHHNEHPTLLNNLAVLELQADQERVAVEYLRNAYRQQPRHFEVLVNLGGIYLRGGQFAKAKDFFVQASRLRSTPALKRQLAVSYHLTGDYRKAKGLYENLLKEDMRNVALMFNYATLLVEHLKDLSEAKVWLDRISFLGSDDRDLMMRVQRLSEKTL